MSDQPILNSKEELAARIESLETELEAVKKERTAARTQATKAENKASTLEAVKAGQEQQLEAAKTTIADLKDELATQAAEIAHLKEKVHQKQKNLPNLEQLRAKAKIVMDQQDTTKVFISLTGQVFLDENTISNAFGSRYKIATLVDEDKVQLSKPFK